MIKTTDLSRDEARNMVHAAFAGMVAEVDDGLALATSRPDLELLELVHLSDERIGELRLALASHQYPQQAALLAETMLGGSGRSLECLPQARRTDVAHGMTRALIEQQRLFQFRLTERLMPWTPDDPFFREVNCTEAGRLRARSSTAASGQRQYYG